jgi:cytochrome b
MRQPEGWDWLVRLAHWSVVVLFSLNYFFVSPDDYTHVQIGYSVAAVVVVRILWGFTFARGANRILNFVPTFRKIKTHLDELQQRQAPEKPGHNPLGAIAIWLMWFGLLAVPTTGWLFDNTDWGFDNDLDKLHKQLGEILFYLICIHIAAVVLTSLWLKRNLIKAMITGRF